MRSNFFIPYFKFAVFLALILFLAFLLAQKINFATADLGRHIKNGELLWQSFGHGFWQNSVLRENTYSYTNPSFSVLNHHWGSGILFYLIFNLFGFSGLSVFYIFLLLSAFSLFFFVSVKVSGWRATVLGGLLVIPLIAYRNEVRPEGFTYLFSASYVFLLFVFTNNTKTKLIWLLPLIQVLWVNTHIYFILGPAIICAFLLPLFLQKSNFAIKLLPVFVATVLASLFSPFCIKGVLYPFTIFSNYGYRVLENQTVWFLERLHVSGPAYVWFLPCLALAIICFAWTVFSLLRFWHTQKAQFLYWAVCLALGGTFMGLFAVRNFALFGLFSLPLFSQMFKRLFTNKHEWLRSLPVYVSLLLVLLAAQFFIFYKAEAEKNFTRGFGPLLGVMGAAEFIKSNQITGPIFNNYDLGGYLVYALYPDQKVFVDNRPEGYPKEFFSETYIPMQEQEAIWQQELRKYSINAIVFYYHDATPWAQTFLKQRIQDPSWVPIFADQYIIILVNKSNSINDVLVQKYQLPSSMFRMQ